MSADAARCGSDLTAHPARCGQSKAAAGQSNPLLAANKPVATVAPVLPGPLEVPCHLLQAARSEGAVKVLLVVVVSGGSPPGVPPTTLKCSEAGVPSRGHGQAVLTSLSPLTHEQKYQVRVR
mmetsp:Transcript_5033/g.16630  ORF Transcript_5033/g.16630 Transcript_5033/m.16630 type:complete len:122 (-) Transcript_5033:196-561(-)